MTILNFSIFSCCVLGLTNNNTTHNMNYSNPIYDSQPNNYNSTHCRNKKKEHIYINQTENQNLHIYENTSILNNEHIYENTPILNNEHIYENDDQIKKPSRKPIDPPSKTKFGLRKAYPDTSETG